MKKNIKTTFIKCIKVNDPETNEPTELEIHYDPEAKAMFALESTYSDSYEVCNSPYNTQYRMALQEPPENYRIE